jgi:hypothetical protein
MDRAVCLRTLWEAYETARACPTHIHGLQGKLGAIR